MQVCKYPKYKGGGDITGVKEGGGGRRGGGWNIWPFTTNLYKYRLISEGRYQWCMYGVLGGWGGKGEREFSLQSVISLLSCVWDCSLGNA